jgi:hypothetical protein
VQFYEVGDGKERMTLFIDGAKDGKTCISFRLPAREGQNKVVDTSYGSSIALFILHAVKGELRLGAYEVTDPEKGKVASASMACKAAKGKVTMLAIMSKMGSLEDWQLRTAYSLSRELCSDSLSGTEIAFWERVCSSVENALKKTLSVEGIQWTSHEEADRRCTS